MMSNFIKDKIVRIITAGTSHAKIMLRGLLPNEHRGEILDLIAVAFDEAERNLIS